MAESVSGDDQYCGEQGVENSKRETHVLTTHRQRKSITSQAKGYPTPQGGMLGLLVWSGKRTTLMGHQFISSIYSINVTINLQPKSINVSYPNKTINLTINVDHQCGIDDHQCTARLEGARAQASIYSINVAVSSTGHQCGPSIWH